MAIPGILCIFRVTHRVNTHVLATVDGFEYILSCDCTCVFLGTYLNLYIWVKRPSPQQTATVAQGLQVY